MELAGLTGYYIMIAMTLLAHEVPLPAVLRKPPPAAP